MELLSNFSESIEELINENKVTIEQFATSVDIDLSEVYRYLRKEYLPSLSNIIKIADFYKCSVDYLLGFIPFSENATFMPTPAFCESFKAILKRNNVTRYKVSKETGISINRLDDWYNGKFMPSLEKAIKLAKYFNCSLDYLLGRES